MANRKCLYSPIYFLLLILLTGCWDQVNIEEHGFVIGIAIDMASDESGEKNAFALTDQIVSPGDLGTPTSDSSDESPFINLTTIGESIFAMSQNMLKETSRAPYYEHTRLIIISADVAQDPERFASMLDVFIRNQQMRRGVKVFIAEEKAKNILEINPKPEKLPVMHIDMITDHAYQSMDMIEPVTLGSLHSHLLNEKSYVLPKVSAFEDRVDYNGVAVFNGVKDQMAGSLNGQETIGMNLIKGDMKGGYIKFKIDNHTMVFELEQSKSEIQINPNDPANMDVSITIDVEGNLAEMYGSKPLLDSSYLAKIEEKIAEKIEQMAQQTIHKAQKEFKLDILDIDKTLIRKHYNAWKKIERNWENGENYFSKSHLNVSANVKVRETGATDRAKDK